MASNAPPEGGPNYPVVGAPYPPHPVIRPLPGCCQCVGLSFAGWMSVIILILLFWPLAWIPCMMESCFDQVQRPVYGWPPQPPPGGYTAPYTQQPPRAPVVAEPAPSAAAAGAGPPEYGGARMADEPPAKQA